MSESKKFQEELNRFLCVASSHMDSVVNECAEYKQALATSDEQLLNERVMANELRVANDKLRKSLAESGHDSIVALRRSLEAAEMTLADRRAKVEQQESTIERQSKMIEELRREASRIGGEVISRNDALAAKEKWMADLKADNDRRAAELLTLTLKAKEREVVVDGLRQDVASSQRECTRLSAVVAEGEKANRNLLEDNVSLSKIGDALEAQRVALSKVVDQQRIDLNEMRNELRIAKELTFEAVKTRDVERRLRLKLEQDNEALTDIVKSQKLSIKNLNEQVEQSRNDCALRRQQLGSMQVGYRLIVDKLGLDRERCLDVDYLVGELDERINSKVELVRDKQALRDELRECSGKLANAEKLVASQAAHIERLQNGNDELARDAGRINRALGLHSFSNVDAILSKVGDLKYCVGVFGT